VYGLRGGRPYTLVVTDEARPRVRRVTRVVRDVDPWSVAKVGLAFHLVVYVVVLVSLVLLWNVADATGTLGNVERFMESFGWETFSFDGGRLFANAWVLGLLAVVLLTGLWVIGAVVFNLIAELVGGVRVSVLEEEVVATLRDVTVGEGPDPR
jgi:hypothetical protein